MVVISLPTTIANFDGEISHVVVAGNEALAFVRPSRWQEERMSIVAKLREFAPSLQKFITMSEVKSGQVYIANVKGSLERSHVIRRPTPETYSIYLIDKGMQCEVHFEDIYDVPEELLHFGLFNCICPVLIPSVEQLSILKAFVGRKCKCEVETITRSMVVLGYIRGRLLVENGDVYEDLRDIACGKAMNRFDAASAQADDSSGSELSYRCSSTEQAGPKRQTSARAAAKKVSVASKKEKCDQQFDDQSDTELPAECDFVKEDASAAGTLFIQAAFKQYEPDVIPTTLSVRFDKRNRTMNTFWVVNKEVFSAVERVLKVSAERLAEFPQIHRRDEDIQMRQIPCIVRTRADTAYKSLYRAVPAQYDTRRKRYSIFLVDFGWFKWVLANDIIDISTMDESDPIRKLPVALIHCREDVTSVLHAKDLNKGTSCDMRVKGISARNVFTVELLKDDSATEGQPSVAAIEQSSPEESFVSNVQEPEVSTSCKQPVTDNYQQQFLASVMEKLSVASRDLAAQSRNFRPNYCPSPFPMPMMVPLAPPMMMPMPLPNNTNTPAIRAEDAMKPESVIGKDLESSRAPQSNFKGYRSSRDDVHSQSFQGIGSQHAAKEWDCNEVNGGSAFGAVASDKNKERMPRSSLDEGGSDGLSREQASKFAKDHRMCQKNLDVRSESIKLASWERTTAADREVQAETGNGNVSDGTADFQCSNEE